MDQNLNVVGQRAYSAGGLAPGRAGKLGDLIISALQGDNYEAAYNSQRYWAASQAVATTTVGLATTYTGLCLSNPVGSGYNLAVDVATMMQSVIQSTQVEAFALAVGYNSSTNVTHTTPGTVNSAKYGATSGSVAKVDTAATLPTAPVYFRFVQNTATATANGPGGVADLKGGLLLQPGAYVCWVTPAQASVAGMWFSFEWTESLI